MLSEPQLRWLAGVSPVQFAGLVAKLEPRWRDQRMQRLSARARLRAVGAGRRFEMPFATRLFVTLVYLRWNVGYRGLGAMLGFSKDTVNRAVEECTVLLAELGITRPDGSRVGDETELAAALAKIDHRAIADGTFVPTPRPGGGWEAQKRQYSGHRHRHCRTTQVITDLWGSLLWVGNAEPGPTHDLTGLLGTPVPGLVSAGGGTLLADRGYQGIAKHVTNLEALLPTRGGARGEGTYNSEHARVRVKVEHAIGAMKRRKILHGFRRRPATLNVTLKAIAALTTLPK